LAVVPIVVVLLLDQGVPFGPARDDRFSVSRRVNRSRVVEGELVVVELTITNEGNDLERIVLEDELPEGLVVTRGSTRMVCALKRGTKATLRYEVALSEPGDVHFGPYVLRIQSLFRLSEKRFDLIAPASIKMYPKFFSRRVFASRSKTYSFAGNAPSRYKGGRLEFMNIRGHVYGDPLRDINWKASARLGKRLVNEWHAERGLDCIMIVDLLRADIPRVGIWSGRSGLISSSYELAHGLVGSGNRLGLLVLGQTPVKLHPGFGSRHLRILLDLIITAREGTVWDAGSIEGFLRSFFRKQYRFRAGALFFVTTTPNADLLNAVKTLSAKGFSCHTIIANVLDDEARALTELRASDATTLATGARVARAEMEWFEKRFELYSKVFEWTRESGFVGFGRGPQ